MTQVVKFGCRGSFLQYFRQKQGLLSVLGGLLLLASCGPSGVTVVESTGPSVDSFGSCLNGPTSSAVRYFNENPRTASGNPALPFSTTLSSSYASNGVLSGLAGNCLLKDAQFKVVEDDFYPSQIAVANGDMIFNPGEPEFRQVNSFYHAAGLRDLMTGLGVGVSGFGVVSIIAGCNAANNAYFYPTAKEVCLGYRNVSGGKTVWAADDGDVVVHEVGHGFNHFLATSQSMYSTGEAGAIDEGVADYWAISRFGNSKVGEWFIGAIGSAFIRDAASSNTYPQDMVYEVHDDSRVIAQVLWDLRKPENLGATTTDGLVKNALTLLPATVRFQDWYLAMEVAAGPGFLNLTAPKIQLIRDKFQAKGIHRTDSVTGVQVSTAQPVFVIDDHTFSVQSGGNCNAQLDVGETALVMVNLENASGANLGVVVANLLSPLPSGIAVVSGGSWGEYFKFSPNHDFLQSLNSTVGDDREYATLGASFLLKATSSGVKTFNFKVTPMNTGLSTPTSTDLSKNLSFSITVGSAATADDCSSGSLWP